jgi:hypothetical protein
MLTNRAPLQRFARAIHVTDVAVELFVRLEAHRAACCCPPRDWITLGAYAEHRRCEQCEAAGKIQARLHEELGCGLGDRPCVQHPDQANPWPEDSIRGREWTPDWERQERWWALYDAALAAGFDVPEPSDDACTMRFCEARSNKVLHSVLALIGKETGGTGIWTGYP